MTEDQAILLREKLIDHRARLLEFAVQKVDADPNSWGWLRMVGDVQAALDALEATTENPN